MRLPFEHPFLNELLKRQQLSEIDYQRRMRMECSLSEIKELMEVSMGQRGSTQSGFPLLSENVFIRTVTYHYIGRATEVKAGFVRLADASWIAESARWATTLESGELNEVEPYPGDCYVSLASIVDVTKWDHKLPREQK